MEGNDCLILFDVVLLWPFNMTQFEALEISLISSRWSTVSHVLAIKDSPDAMVSCTYSHFFHHAVQAVESFNKNL